MFSPVFQDAVEAAGACPTMQCLFVGRTCISFNFLNYLWKLAWGTHSSVTAVHRSIQFLWQAAVEKRWFEAVSPSQQEQVRALEALHRAQMPTDKLLDGLLYNTWAIRSGTWGEALHESVANDEGQVLRFDFTYRAVGGIWVDAPVPGAATTRQRSELAYVLGSVLGGTGVVLASIISSTEAWCNIEAVFRMAFQKTKVPPTQIWVDDYAKWSRLLLQLVTNVFGPDHGTLIGLDWYHFKELLLSHMDKRNGQYQQVRAHVEGLHGRMINPESENPITCGEELRAAVKEIFDKFSGQPDNAVMLLRGAPFSRQLTFDVCSALGTSLLGGWFNVDMGALMTRSTRHGVFTEQVTAMWEAKLAAPIDYWDAVALVHDCPAEYSAGTNMVECLHSTLRRDATLMARKSYNKCLVALDMNLKRFNYSVIKARYRTQGYVTSIPSSLRKAD